MARSAITTGLSSCRPLALMPVYNEADILPWTLAHLLEQGCDVHVIDNWSTDGSADLAQAAGVNVECWPATGPIDIYDWTGLLKRVEEIAEANRGRWVILHDADEIRRADSGETLADALAGVECTGFNAVQYRVATFEPIDDGYQGDPESYFRHYRLDGLNSRMPHIKTWLQGPDRVDIHTHGGHQALFPGRRVSPARFTLKHYPIRTQAQGERKIFQDRRPRWADAERAKWWHVQYDEAHPGKSFIANPGELLCVDA